MNKEKDKIKKHKGEEVQNPLLTKDILTDKSKLKNLNRRKWRSSQEMRAGFMLIEDELTPESTILFKLGF